MGVYEIVLIVDTIIRSGTFVLMLWLLYLLLKRGK